MSYNKSREKIPKKDPTKLIAKQRSYYTNLPKGFQTIDNWLRYVRKIIETYSFNKDPNLNQHLNFQRDLLKVTIYTNSTITVITIAPIFKTRKD